MPNALAWANKLKWDSENSHDKTETDEEPCDIDKLSRNNLINIIDNYYKNPCQVKESITSLHEKS